MITTVIPQSQNISKADALWVLIQSQTKAVRKAKHSNRWSKIASQELSMSCMPERFIGMHANYLPNVAKMLSGLRNSFQSQLTP